jgi:hypothetical protein
MEAQAWVNYWTHFATSNTNYSRTVRRGSHDGPLLSKEELERDAFSVATNHLRRFRDIEDAIIEVGREIDNIDAKEHLGDLTNRLV